MSNLSEEARALGYCTLETLNKIKANNYIRLTKPRKRYDPEIVDRLIAKRIRMKKLRMEKYSRTVNHHADAEPVSRTV